MNVKLPNKDISLTERYYIFLIGKLKINPY